jgi:hypothetical protein
LKNANYQTLKKTNMNQTQIAIEIFHDLFNEEQRIGLSNQPLVDVGENHQPIFPDNFPDEIYNPIISDNYGYEGLPEENKDGSIILGSYTPMNSPGVITFYRKNIKQYSSSLIRKVINSGISLGLDTALFTIYFVVEDIMQHESFHYYCDYKRQLTRALYNHDKEEAYAVAHSYQEMHDWHTFYHAFMHGSEYNTFFSNYFHNGPNVQLCKNRMNAIFEFLLKEHYKGFTLVGYRDWHLYKNSVSYKTHFFDYLKNELLENLLVNGVPVNDIFWEISHLKNKGAIIRLL